MGLDIKTLAVAKKIMSNGTSNNNISSSDINGNIKINGVETSVYTHPEGTNPHGTTKEDIGLGSVENKKIDDQTPNFEISNTRENIFGGEKLSVILGKIKKYFSDLKSVAFSGSYNDLNDKPALKTVATSGSYNDLNDKPTMRIINKDHIIKNLTNISQINEIGFWSINAIEQSYAEQIALDRNTGDFHAICCNYNGNGIDRFDFGNLLLFSPRFGTSYYYINVWEGNATAIKSVLKSNLLNTIEQISANTSTDNVCSALALKAAMADYTNKFNQLNSDLGDFSVKSAVADAMSDANDCKMGIYQLRENAQNSPFSFWSTIISTTFRDDWSQQICMPWGAGERRIAYRVKDHNGWHEWCYINLS